MKKIPLLLFILIGMVSFGCSSPAAEPPPVKTVSAGPVKTTYPKPDNQTVSYSLKQLGFSNSMQQELNIVDNIGGSSFLTLAVYFPKPNRDKFIVTIDRLHKQTGDTRFIVYFVDSQNYSIERRRSLSHMVMAVYASTTRELQILNSDGTVAETLSNL
jgi:hypothetical protein